MFVYSVWMVSVLVCGNGNKTEENEKQDIDIEKQNIIEKKQDIKFPKTVVNKTQKHIQDLFVKR